MKILVANVGSTSYKCRLIDMDGEKDLATAAVERVGEDDAIVSYKAGENKIVDKEIMAIPSHREAVKLVMDYMTGENGIISSTDEISGVGFKTIQAGEKNGSVLLDKDVTDAMEEYAALAPAHNPPYLNCIYYFKKAYPNIPLVGVFEPGFHMNVPEYARVFGVPYEWYDKYQVKKYGYHGATFRYVTAHACEMVGADVKSAKVIACHLGGSSSVCAFKDGVSVDVSMSFTPQSGLIQSARVGDVDPFVVPYIMEKTGKSIDEVLNEMGKNGGLQGISGVGADIRDVEKAASEGNERAKLALDKFVYDVVRYIGSFYAVLQGVDIIAFSGGIGQYDEEIRTRIIEHVSFLGIDVDESTREDRSEGVKTLPTSKVKVVTVETNEEIVVARETAKVISK